jgi:hypothetical protein
MDFLIHRAAAEVLKSLDSNRSGGGWTSSQIGVPGSCVLVAKHQDKAGGCPSLYDVCRRALTAKPKKLAGYGLHRKCAIVWTELIVRMRFQFEELDPSFTKIEQLFGALWICALHD